jgi:NADP-dependent 3-hydroxy acid dehydrogenase YdfG
MNKQFSGRTAIVTGGSSGIGLATATVLAAAGAAVVMTARRKEPLQAAAARIAETGGTVLPIACDAGEKGDLDLLLERALAWREGGNKYDMVIVNAGRGLAGGILDSDDAQWEELYRTNVLGAAHLMRQSGRYLAGRGSGDIVVIGSVVGRNVSPFSGFYGSSKFAVGAMAEALRREVCSKGVRVSLVLPGIVTSGFQEVAGYDEENFGKSVALFGRLLEPDAIAEGIRWLLSLPPHVNINELSIRPTGQNYP